MVESSCARTRTAPAVAVTWAPPLMYASVAAAESCEAYDPASPASPAPAPPTASTKIRDVGLPEAADALPVVWPIAPETWLGAGLKLPAVAPAVNVTACAITNRR